MIPNIKGQQEDIVNITNLVIRKFNNINGLQHIEIKGIKYYK